MNLAETRAELIAKNSPRWEAFVQAAKARTETDNAKAEWSALMNERTALFVKARNADLAIAGVCWDILGEWGGMHGGNIKALKSVKDSRWLELAEAVRNGKHDRRSAYDSFSEFRAGGYLPGMGPAYFTKLIYFLMPRGPDARSPGYIMDQWAGCSVNVLAGHPIVLTDCVQNWKLVKGKRSLGASYVVSHVNDGGIYETYCRCIEEIALAIDRSADETELLLMSKGGKQKYAWRQHVIKHRQQPRE